ncbi:MAG: hypothetical protein P4L82_19215 [Ancalomicrobiaceae bacterium]|nr:hypothetical protein [Ancalomicrobiaceae bacterium]
MYRRLDPDLLVATIERLAVRIAARFPQSDLLNVCGELAALGRDSAKRAEHLGRPNWALRICVMLIVVAGFGVFLYLAARLDFDPGTRSLFTLVQSVDALFNLAVLAGAAVVSLLSIETRLVRARAGKALHPIRAMVHIIDMHQLTKDPGMAGLAHLKTSVSPPRDLSPFELTRYLDYCSEMLSLTAKLAALIALATEDAVIAGAVNDIETLAGTIAQKIWQKIMIADVGVSPAEAD